MVVSMPSKGTFLQQSPARMVIMTSQGQFLPGGHPSATSPTKTHHLLNLRLNLSSQWMIVTFGHCDFWINAGQLWVRCQDMVPWVGRIVLGLQTLVKELLVGFCKWFLRCSSSHQLLTLTASTTLHLQGPIAPRCITCNANLAPGDAG